jgi:hypothetical protein
MMKKAVLTILLFCYAMASFAQYDNYPQPRPKNCETENSCPRNTIFHETTFRFDRLGLNWNSLNWDHLLICRTNYLLSFRLGVDYMSFAKMRSVGAPLDLNLMIGGGALMAEISAGLNYLFIYRNYDEVLGKFDDNLSYLAAMGRIGLRFERKHSIFFRAGWTPMYSLFGNDEVQICKKKKKTGEAIYVIRDRPLYSMFTAGIGYTF